MQIPLKVDFVAKMLGGEGLAPSGWRAAKVQ